MQTIYLDGRAYPDGAAVHAALKLLLDLPAYYGANADALYDCLTDIREDTVIGLYLPEERYDYFGRLCHTLRDAQRANPHLAVVFSDPDENSSRPGEIPVADEIDQIHAMVQEFSEASDD